MTDFARPFKNDHNNISDAVERSVCWLVRFCHPIAQSHRNFVLRMEEFIRQMHFHLPLFALTLFRTSKLPPPKSVTAYL